MEYTIVTASKAAELDLIPETMADRLGEMGGFAVIAFNSEEMTGIAVFSYTDDIGSVSFDYILVAESFRRK